MLYGPSPHASGLKTEASLLYSLTKVSRLQHRRAPYFARVLDVRRRLHAVVSDLHGATSIRSNAVAKTELALQAIPAAWKEMHLLLTQSFFMPYALTHLALLARIATLLAMHHSYLRSTLPRGAPAAAPAALPPPRLLALSTSTSADAALARIFGGVDAAPVAVPTSGSAPAPPVSMLRQPPQPQRRQPHAGEAAGSEDLGEAMAVDELPVGEAAGSEDLGEARAVDELPAELEAAGLLPEARAPGTSGPSAAAAVAVARTAVDSPAEEMVVLWEIDPTPNAPSPHQDGASAANGAADDVADEPDAQVSASGDGPNDTTPAANGWAGAVVDAPASAGVHTPEKGETSRAPADLSDGCSVPSLHADPGVAPLLGAALRRRKRETGSLDRLVHKYRLL